MTFNQAFLKELPFCVSTFLSICMYMAHGHLFSFAHIGPEVMLEQEK